MMEAMESGGKGKDTVFDPQGGNHLNDFEGQYISILGASTSTFDGFSNDENCNSTIKNNTAYYPKPELVSCAEHTWWMRTVAALGLNLCVNNSWSGSCVSTVKDGPEKAACMNRATELHNDKLGIEPDIIVLIIGGNDALRGYDVGTYNGVRDIFDPHTKRYIGDCTTFGQAYATMVHKVKTRYPNAVIYVSSMLHWRTRNCVKGLLPYNAMIRKIALEFHVHYVDFYNKTSISPETEHLYLHTDGIHPNQLGFAQMADCLINEIKRNAHP